MTVSFVVVMCVVVVSFVAAFAVVVAVLYPSRGMLDEQLYHKTDKNRCCNLEMQGTRYELLSLCANENVWHEVDKTTCQQKCTAKNGDMLHRGGRKLTTTRR